MGGKISQRLVDRITMLDELPLGVASTVTVVLPHLYRQMIIDSEDG